MEACLGSQVQDHTGLAVDQILDHIAVVVDSSHRTVVVEDILEAGKEVGRDEMEGLAVKEVVLVEMNSILQDHLVCSEVKAVWVHSVLLRS